MNTDNSIAEIEEKILPLPASPVETGEQRERGITYLLEKLRYVLGPLSTSSQVSEKDIRFFENLAKHQVSEEKFKSYLDDLNALSPWEKGEKIVALFHEISSPELLVLLPLIPSPHWEHLAVVLRNGLADKKEEASFALNVLSEVLPAKTVEMMVNSISFKTALVEPISKETFQACLKQNRMSTDDLFASQLIDVLGQLPPFEEMALKNHGLDKVSLCLEKIFEMSPEVSFNKESIWLLNSLKFWKEPDVYKKEVFSGPDLFTPNLSLDLCFYLGFRNVLINPAGSPPAQVLAHTMSTVLKEVALGKNNELEGKVLKTFERFSLLMENKELAESFHHWLHSSHVSEEKKSQFLNVIQDLESRQTLGIEAFKNTLKINNKTFSHAPKFSR